MPYQAPKAIINHPAVAECVCGVAGGSDYKHDVFLKEGWAFEYGRTAGCRGLLCHTVADFKSANPIKAA